jgi:hypothetical protein
MMKKHIPFHVLQILLGGLFMWCAAGCFEKKVAPIAYQNAAFGVQFQAPQRWIQVPDDSGFSLAQFSSPNGNAMLYFSAMRNSSVYFDSLDDSFQGFIQIIRFNHPQFLVLTNYPIKVAGLDAIRFQGMMGTDFADGVFLANNLDQVSLTLSHESATDGMSRVLSDVLESFTIYDPSPSAHRLKQLMEETVKKTSINDIRNAIDYGRQLMLARNVNPNYYSGAIDQFETVLVSLCDQKPRPPEFEEALALLNLTYAFRYETYLKYKYQLDRGIGLGFKDQAIDAANYIMDMFSSSAPEFQYANKQFMVANQIKFGQTP